MTHVWTFAAALGLVLSALVAAPAPAHAAGGAVVYVAAETGDDAGAGTRTAPLRTLGQALTRIAGDGGRIVLMDDYPLNTSITEPAHTGDILVTSTDGETDFPGRLVFGDTAFIEYRLAGPTTFADLGVVHSQWAVFEAAWNPITFGQRVVMTSTPTAGKRQVILTGGYHAPAETDDVLDADSHITIDSGTFYKVAGFSRAKGYATQTYTGTSHITINGGIVQELFGGSIENHYSGSTVISMTGGRVGPLHTGGDATRYLTGSAKVELSGGHVNTVDINNVVDDVDLTLSGVDYDAITVSNRSVSVERDTQLEEVAQVRSVRYGGQHYTAAQVATLRSLFDVATNIARIHVDETGSGTACTQAAPCASLATAVGRLNADGGTISITGDLTWDIDPTALAAGNGRVLFDGDGSASIALAADSDLELGRDVTFTDVRLANAGALDLRARDADVVLGSGISFADGSKVKVVGVGESGITVSDGEVAAVVGVTEHGGAFTGTTNVTVTGGSVQEVWAGSDQDGTIAGAIATISGGSVGTLHSSSGAVDALAVRLLGGTVNDVRISEAQVNLDMRIGAATIRAISIPPLTDGAHRSLIRLPGAAESTIDAVADRFPEVRNDQFVYLAPGGNGDGVSPDRPIGDLGDAVSALVGGGHVVLMESYTIPGDADVAAHAGKAVLTADDGDVDFGDAGAALQIEGMLRLGGATVIDHLTLRSPTMHGSIYAMGHPLTITEDVVTELSRRGKTYLSLVGGRNDAVPAAKIDVAVDAGTWEGLRAGTDDSAAVTTGVDTDVTIDGGVFHGPVVLGHRGAASGAISAGIGGGTFLQGVYAVFEEDGRSYEADYDVDLVIDGGDFWGMIAPAKSRSTVLAGTYDVTLNGGEFGHLTDVAGASGYSGTMTSEIKVSPDVDLSAAPTGEVTFTNTLTTAADPYMFTHDGQYYFLATSAGSTMALHKVANPSDLSHSIGSAIFQPDHLINLWSPEIHHLTAEDVGEEYAGWYLYLSATDPDDGAAEGQRQYVLKALDGDDLLGRWGHPVTGEVNEPIRLTNADDASFNTTEFVAGTSIFRVAGKTYVSFVTEEGRGTSRFHQKLNLSHMVNPWTLSGAPSVITIPEYDWEMQGYAQSSTDPNSWWPKVVEGATAVYGDDGEVFMAYSGSGYWTAYYAIGYLRYTGGDPMDAANWVKHPTPVLSQNSEVNGTGTGPTFTDHDGTRWFMYQARPSTSTQVARHAFMEPYSAGADGLTIGDGSGHPAPLTTQYTMSVNPIPLGDKIVGFVPPDQTAPETSLVSPSAAGPMREVTIEVTASDAVGLASITADVYAGDELVETTQTALHGVTSGSHTATVTVPDGDYTIRYRAQDTAGNTSPTGNVRRHDRCHRTHGHHGRPSSQHRQEGRRLHQGDVPARRCP
ncbi:GH43 family beta-xylosidase [Microbacterium sp. W4I4]|uniref:hypothetical protein n=1 Tax=Microbacterium sp. W4I4 TaxID=3042295 RepID=UPI0027857649|nr:hypothetical protein [Microbacterium sp. W4I4]MDQ0615842.1 GH43 family beta-xylosidase [Microbacterium sp. W4I4]